MGVASAWGEGVCIGQIHPVRVNYVSLSMNPAPCKLS